MPCSPLELCGICAISSTGKKSFLRFKKWMNQCFL